MMYKHVSKIFLEVVQMLCSAKRILDPNDEINDRIYKLAHKNHWTLRDILEYIDNN